MLEFHLMYLFHSDWLIVLEGGLERLSKEEIMTVSTRDIITDGWISESVCLLFVLFCFKAGMERGLFFNHSLSEELQSEEMKQKLKQWLTVTTQYAGEFQLWWRDGTCLSTHTPIPHLPPYLPDIRCFVHWIFRSANLHSDKAVVHFYEYFHVYLSTVIEQLSSIVHYDLACCTCKGWRKKICTYVDNPVYQKLRA